MKLLLAAVIIGTSQVTSYRSVVEQTDSSPFFTSIGERVNAGGVAVSQDLLKKNGGPLDYGDYIYIEYIGIKRVNDCMNIRHKNSFDVWVATHEEEKAFDKKMRGKSPRIWLIKPKLEP